MYIKEKTKNQGFASTVLVLSITLLLLGVLVGTYTNSAIKHRATVSSVARQATQPIMDKEARRTSEGVVEQIIRGMNGHLAGAELSVPIPQNDINNTEEITERVNRDHVNRAKKLIKDTSGRRFVRTATAIPTFKVLPVWKNKNATIANNANRNYLQEVDSRGDNVGFDQSVADKGIAVLHPIYTYGDKNPHRMPEPNNPFGRINAFSGGKFWINDRPTNGFALYESKMFPGLATNNKPMLGRLHIYNFDQMLAPIDIVNKLQGKKTVKNKGDKSIISQPRFFKTKIYLMEIPNQSAVDVKGDLKLDSSDLWSIADIDGRISGDNIDIDNSFNIGDNSISGEKINYDTIVTDNGTVRSKDQKNELTININGTSQKISYNKKQHDQVQKRNIISKSFLINPEDYTDDTTFYTWPKNRPENKWTTSTNENSTQGGPTLNQYVSGITQCDLHIRIKDNDINVFKITDGSTRALGNPSTGTYKSQLAATITETNNKINVNIEKLRKAIANIIGKPDISGESKGWPIRGIAIYKDPNESKNIQKQVVLRGMRNMTNFYYGVSIISEFEVAIDSDLNSIEATNQSAGIIKDYKDLADPTLPTGELYVPVGIYAKQVRFFETDTSLGSINFNGAIGTDNKDGNNQPALKVNQGSITSGSTVNLKGVNHQIELPPITPIKWQITYLVEELGGEVAASGGGDWLSKTNTNGSDTSTSSSSHPYNNGSGIQVGFGFGIGDNTKQQ